MSAFGQALTRGAIGAIVSGRRPENPVVQVVRVRQIKQENQLTNQRFKMDLCDGNETINAMLAQQQNELVSNGTLADGCVVELTNYVCNDVLGRKIIIVLDCKLLAKAPLGWALAEPAAAGAGAQQQQQQAPQAQLPPQHQHQQPQVMRPQQSAPPRQYGGAPPASGAQQTPQPPAQQQRGFAPMQGVSPMAAPSSTFQHGGGMRGPIASAGGLGNVIPIRGINPYQNRWTIKARVVSKTEIKRWDKGADNSGQLFSVTLMDKDGSEIRGTFFREGVDKFFPLLAENQVYTFSGGKVKLANKSFSQVAHDYELTFDNNSEVVQCQDDGGISMVQLHRCMIADLATQAVNAMVDVAGVVTEIGQLSDFKSKAEKQLTKIEVQLADESGASVRVTIWNERARDFAKKTAEMQHIANPVVLLRQAKISDFGGRTLSANQVMLEPDTPEATELRRWFAGGGAAAATSLSSRGGGAGAAFAPGPVAERHLLREVKDLGLGKSEKGDFVEVKATVTFIPGDAGKKLWYYSATDSNNKVTRASDGSWEDTRNSKSYSTKVNRYILKAIVADSSCQMFVSLFNEQGITLMGGKSADELEVLRETDEGAFQKLLSEVLFKTYHMRLKVKDEIYQEQHRQAATVVSIMPIDYAKECAELIKAIAKYS
jgi:replication factor A1